MGEVIFNQPAVIFCKKHKNNKETYIYYINSAIADVM